MADEDDGLRGHMVPEIEGEDGLLLKAIPHCAELGMRLMAASGDGAVMKLPYDARLVGDARTGIMHGGAITTLIDTCCGSAVMAAGTGAKSTATLDLRINYMRPATPGRDVLARAACYRSTRSVAFVRATAFHEEGGDEIATASAAFILER